LLHCSEEAKKKKTPVLAQKRVDFLGRKDVTRKIISHDSMTGPGKRSRRMS